MIKPVRTLAVLSVVLAGGLATAQFALAATPGAGKPIVQTTCQDFLAMDETIKPKFIYYAVGHGSKGQPEAVLDVAGTDTIQPELEKYCKVNLTKSAYEHVMQTSIATDPTRAKK